MHLYRAKYVPKGGPDGGDGGRGGSIILKADPQYWTLIHLKFRRHIIAEDGEGGSGALCHGKNGADITLRVAFPAGAAETFQLRLTELSAGSLTMTAAGEEFLPGPREEAN